MRNARRRHRARGILHAQGSLARSVGHRRKETSRTCGTVAAGAGRGVVAGHAVRRSTTRRHQSRLTAAVDENMIGLINPVTNRLHADFRQIGAPTGRFACTNPNIQQVPHALEYRRCFSGYPAGRKLIIADYSQIELRILAEFSGDRGFIEAFNSGADLHRVTASQVFNATLDQVTKEQRDFAKRLNFGVVYGIGAQRFAMMTGLTVPNAENVLRRYFGTYRQLDTYLREAANRAVSDRQARTASGRLVRFRYDENDRQQISMTQRNGKNTPIQGDER